MVIAFRLCVGRAQYGAKIAFLFGSGKSFFPSGNGDAALRARHRGFSRGRYPNSSFSTRARRYPALRIWRSISGKALVQEILSQPLAGLRPFELRLAHDGVVVEPVARRSGCYGLPFGLGKAVQLIGPPR